MALSIAPLLLLLALAGVMAAFYSIKFWREREIITGGAHLSLIMACVLLWTGATAMEFLITGQAFLFVENGAILVALGILPAALLLFSLSYSGKSLHYPELVVGTILLIIPAGMGAVLLSAGNAMPVQATIGTSPPVMAFWIFTLYSLFLTLIAISIVIQSYQLFSGIFHGQLTCLLVAILVPFFLHSAFLFRFGLFGIIDLAPFTIIISIVVIAVGMDHYHLFDIIPVEHGEVLRQAGTGIVVLDKNDRILAVNPSARRMLSIGTRDITGRPVKTFLSSPDVPEIPINPAGIGNDLIRKEVDGTLCYLEIRNTPLFSGLGERRGSVMVLSDVTDRILTGQSLNMARRNINLLNAITRHDILNQLTVIILHNEILRTTVTDQSLMRSVLEQEKAAKTIRRQIEFTKDYEKLGENIPEWVNIEKLFRRHAKLQGFEHIHCSIHAEGIEVFADPLIDRVFENLLDNSSRYGQKVTEIRLSSTQHLDGLTIIYEDNGVGIPATDKPRIFQRGAGRNIGFGLFFSREILSITGIAIRETGVEGEGARFEILIPWGRFRFQKNGGTGAVTNTDTSK